MKRNIFLFGSLAYDNIITYDGFFKELIDSDIERSYNFSFLSTNVIKEYGGCAGNIAYNLKLIQAVENFNLKAASGKYCNLCIKSIPKVLYILYFYGVCDWNHTLVSPHIFFQFLLPLKLRPN